MPGKVAVTSHKKPNSVRLLGKAELAAALSWSRPRLDRKLESDPDFPIAERDEDGRGLRFDLAAVRAHLKRGPTARPALSQPEPTAADGERLRVVGKAELAREFVWSRPTLDRRLESDPHFPVLSRGDQSGGWQFILQDARAYMDGRPLPSAQAGALRPRGLPIVETEVVRLEGLSQEEIGIIASLGEYLPRGPVLGSFANAVSAMMESTRLAAHKIFDYLEAQAERGALSVPAAHGMMGVLFDLAEKMLLGQTGVSEAGRNAVRTKFDGIRMEFISDYLGAAAKA